MKRGRLALALLLSPAAAGAASARWVAYREGKPMSLPAFTASIARADRAPLANAALTARSPAGAAVPFKLEERAGGALLSWEKAARVVVSLPWPAGEDGFSTVWLDKDGQGFGDGETILVNEEAALTQYRLLKESWRRRTTDAEPLYAPSGRARRRFEIARDAMARAHALQNESGRARGFDIALAAAGRAWREMLVEHGRQIARKRKDRGYSRFGLTLDDSAVLRLKDYERVVADVKRSGADWVRLVFRPNPDDFVYAEPGSFNEYDALVDALLAKELRVMACVLETGRWPASLTPELYAERVKNLVSRYQDKIKSWEVGSELNGDWLGSPEAPFSPEQVLSIFNTAAAQVKSLGKSLETVATLYWWDGAAPDDAHSLFGWLRRWSALGFGRNLDVLGVNLQPDDQPVGTALETIFDKTRQALPAQRLMVGSLGYAPQPELDGWYWADAGDVEAARRDVLGFYTPAACAIPHSHCGGFWWLTLEQLLPETGGPTKLYDVYRRELKELGR